MTMTALPGSAGYGHEHRPPAAHRGSTARVGQGLIAASADRLTPGAMRSVRPVVSPGHGREDEDRGGGGAGDHNRHRDGRAGPGETDERRGGGADHVLQQAEERRGAARD